MTANFQFVDTNVLIYAYDQTAGEKNKRAKELLTELWQNGNGCISIQVLQEFHNVATRRLAVPFSLSQSQRLVKLFSQWRVHSPHNEDVIRAIGIQERYMTSFWDAMILQSASQLECGILWSEDLTNEQLFGNVKVVNPFS